MTVKTKISRAAVLLGIAAFGILWYVDPVYSTDETVQLLTKSTVTRGLGSVIFLALTLFLGFRVCHKPSRGWWMAFLPCLVVVVNNLPIIALLDGSATVERTELLPLFLLECFLIGLFEELAFRGTLFLAILEKRRSSNKQIFLTALISSALFGLVHLANLLEGAGVGATLLQVGYSFLIGGMCSIVLLRTGNILFCILLHAIFDVGGGLLSTLGSGSQWNLPTVVITAVLAVIVTAWMILLLLRVRPDQTDRFYPVKEKDGQENGVADAENNF